jgi:hypothetical protein
MEAATNAGGSSILLDSSSAPRTDDLNVDDSIDEPKGAERVILDEFTTDVVVGFAISLPCA